MLPALFVQEAQLINVPVVLLNSSCKELHVPILVFQVLSRIMIPSHVMTAAQVAQHVQMRALVLLVLQEMF
jgi:hypothetical protein